MIQQLVSSFAFLIAISTTLQILSSHSNAAPIEFVIDFQVTGTRSLSVSVGDITPPSGSLLVDENAPGLFQPNSQIDVDSFNLVFDDLDVVSGTLNWTPSDNIISGLGQILFDGAGVPSVAGNLTVRDLSPPDPVGFTDISIFLDGTWDMQPSVGPQLIEGTYTLSAIPEPATFVMAISGLMSLAFLCWRRRQA